MNRCDFIKTLFVGMGMAPVLVSGKKDTVNVRMKAKTKDPEVYFVEYGSYIKTTGKRTKQMDDELKKQIYDTWRALKMSKKDVRERVISVDFIWKEVDWKKGDPINCFNTLGWICKIKK